MYIPPEIRAQLDEVERRAGYLWKFLDVRLLLSSRCKGVGIRLNISGIRIKRTVRHRRNGQRGRIGSRFARSGGSIEHVPLVVQYHSKGNFLPDITSKQMSQAVN